MKEKIFKILNLVSQGALSPEQALEELKSLPFKEIEGAKLDLHRKLRRRVPEIVYGEGKTPEQLLRIARAFIEEGQEVIITRLSREKYEGLKEKIDLYYYEKARIASNLKPRGEKGLVAVITAGTSDESVAEEAAIILELLGIKVERIYDAGAAGIHRIFPYMETIDRASSAIVIAGMEGALPTIVSSMTSTPVIGVPTSVGYGTNFSGVSPLLTMLNSCSSGLTVVNIDNGVAAAVFAYLIQEKIDDQRNP